MMRLEGAKILISNDTKRQKAYDRLRKLTCDRIVRSWGLSSEYLADLSLAQLINLVFLTHGDCGSTGNFNVAFAAAVKLVGPDLVSSEPGIQNISIIQFVQ
jgi:hypothetical protein